MNCIKQGILPFVLLLCILVFNTISMSDDARVV